MYSWCTILCKLQVYNIVIHNFCRLYSVYSYYKILAIFPKYILVVYFFLPLLSPFWVLSPVVAESYWFSVFFCHVVDVLPTLVQVTLPLGFSSSHRLLLGLPCFQTPPPCSPSRSPKPHPSSLAIALLRGFPVESYCRIDHVWASPLYIGLLHMWDCPSCPALTFIIPSSASVQLDFCLANTALPIFQQVFAPVNYFFLHFLIVVWLNGSKTVQL